MEENGMNPERRAVLLDEYPALRWFATDHLSKNMQEGVREALAQVIENFGRQAFHLAASNVRSTETSVAIRKLVEAKDAAVRAAVITLEQKAAKEAREA